jgi:hypothetical protein
VPNAQKAYAPASGEINILCDAEQGPESGMPGAAAVEAEDELVEVGLQMPAAPPATTFCGPGCRGISRPRRYPRRPRHLERALAWLPRRDFEDLGGEDSSQVYHQHDSPPTPTHCDGSAFANANRFVAKVGSTALQDGMGIMHPNCAPKTLSDQRSTRFAAAMALTALITPLKDLSRRLT